MHDHLLRRYSIFVWLLKVYRDSILQVHYSKADLHLLTVQSIAARKEGLRAVTIKQLVDVCPQQALEQAF